MTGAARRIPFVLLAWSFGAVACGDSSEPASGENTPTESDTGTETVTESAEGSASDTGSSAATNTSAVTDVATQTETEANTETESPTATDTGSATQTVDPGPPPVPPDATNAVFSDDFESGAANWNVTQGTCSVMAEATSVLNCLNGGNEARAVGGDATWTDLTVAANVKIRQIDDGRRIYLAARFVDSNNWYGAAFYNSGTRKVQLRKKVAGTSADIAEVPYPFELNTWYTLKLQISGSTLTLSVNDVVQIEATDTQFASGSVALLVDRSEVSWDNVVVTTP